MWSLKSFLVTVPRLSHDVLPPPPLYPRGSLSFIRCLPPLTQVEFGPTFRFKTRTHWDPLNELERLKTVTVFSPILTDEVS